MREHIGELNTFLAFDYSQAEIRLLAEISNDALLISQLQSGRDIHCLVGSTLTGWAPERIANEKNLRRMVKNTVFGVIFGLGRDNLYPYVAGKIREIDGEKADMTGITPERLGKLYDKFFERYDGVARYVAEMRERAETVGVVESVWGFRREVFKDDETRDTYYGNQAVNAPVQSSAHGLMLIALALLHLKPKTYALLRKPVMEVHDALVFLTQVHGLPEAFRQGKHLLETAVVEYAKKHFKRQLRVPLIAEAEAGLTLGSLVDYDGGPVEEWLAAWRVKHREVEHKAFAELATA